MRNCHMALSLLFLAPYYLPNDQTVSQGSWRKAYFQLFYSWKPDTIFQLFYSWNLNYSSCPAVLRYSLS